MEQVWRFILSCVLFRIQLPVTDIYEHMLDQEFHIPWALYLCNLEIVLLYHQLKEMLSRSLITNIMCVLLCKVTKKV